MTGFAEAHADLAQSAAPSQQDPSYAETKTGFLEVSLDDGIALKQVRTSQGALLLHQGLRMLLSMGGSHPIAVDEKREAPLCTWQLPRLLDGILSRCRKPAPNLPPIL